MTIGRFTPAATRLDDAARAGWLYYVAGNTQDQIARKLSVSRQTAQRLVAMAVSERLVKVRIDHPIGRCMDLAEGLRSTFDLRHVDVVPSDPGAPELLTGVAIAAAAELELMLRSPDPRIIALGTGRALKATVEQVPPMDCPQHRVVSLLGNMMFDGSATPYNAVIRMADRVGARHYPYPFPVMARNSEELAVMHAQEIMRNTLRLSTDADVTLVGIGQLGPLGPIVVDGFMPHDVLAELMAAGAAGEITSWVYDGDGHLMDCGHNSKVTSAPLPRAVDRPIIAVAVGEAKVRAIRAALRGQLINGLITNEATAELLLARA